MTRHDLCRRQTIIPQCIYTRDLSQEQRNKLFILLFKKYIFIDTADRLAQLIPQVQRQVLIGVASAHRTISTKALQIVTGTIPIQATSTGNTYIYNKKRQFEASGGEKRYVTVGEATLRSM